MRLCEGGLFRVLYPLALHIPVYQVPLKYFVHSTLSLDLYLNLPPHICYRVYMASTTAPTLPLLRASVRIASVSLCAK